MHNNISLVKPKLQAPIRLINCYTTEASESAQVFISQPGDKIVLKKVLGCTSEKELVSSNTSNIFV